MASPLLAIMDLRERMGFPGKLGDEANGPRE
jgi:hypothetical protein